MFDQLEVDLGHQILAEGRGKSIVYYDVIKKFAQYNWLYLGMNFCLIRYIRSVNVAFKLGHVQK